MGFKINVHCLLLLNDRTQEMKWYLLAASVLLLGQGQASPVEDVKPEAAKELFQATSDAAYVKKEENNGEEQNDHDDDDENDDDDDEEYDDDGEDDDEEDDDKNDDDDEDDEDDDEDDEENDDESFWEKYNAKRPRKWKRMNHKRRRRYKEAIMKKSEKMDKSNPKSNHKILRKARKLMDIGKNLIKGSRKMKEAGDEIRDMAKDVLHIAKRH